MNNFLQKNNIKKLPKVILYLAHKKNAPKNFIKELYLQFPDIKDEIVSASVNADCECRTKIAIYIEIFSENFATFLKEYAEKNNLTQQINKIFESIDKLENTDTPKQQMIHLQGKVAKTSINKWKDFSETLTQDNLIFNSFSVVKEGDELLVFFL
jgi:hypothetical protein